MFDPEQHLHDDVRIIFSSADDGTMAAVGGDKPSNLNESNVEKFLLTNGFSTSYTRLLVNYGDDNTYREVERVTSDTPYAGVLADAMYTTEPNRVMTLPVADCVATVVYDPVTSMLGLLHLGRHSSVAGLIESFVIEVADNVGSDPREWLIWMSPSLRQPNDRLDYFKPPDAEEWSDYVQIYKDGIRIDTVGHNKARFIRAGVAGNRIFISPVDTYADDRFYSHRAATELGQNNRQGRMLTAVYISR